MITLMKALRKGRLRQGREYNKLLIPTIKVKGLN